MASAAMMPPQDLRCLSDEGLFTEVPRRGVLGSLAGRKSYSVLAPVASKMLAGPGVARSIGPTRIAPTAQHGERSRSQPLFTNVVEGEFPEVRIAEVHPCFCSSCNSFATAKTRSMGDT